MNAFWGGKKKKEGKNEVLVQMCNFVGVHPPLCLSGGRDRCFISQSLYKEIIIYLVIHRSNKYSSSTITDEDGWFKYP